MGLLRCTVQPARAALQLNLLLLILLATPLAGAEELVKIGVLAKRGEEKTLQRWSPTADYLSARLPNYHFKIVPLDFSEVDDAIACDEVDFILVNSGIYVHLEYDYGVSRIATLKNRVGNEALSLFGGVIFSRADLKGFDSLADIKGRRFSAVDKTSLGGFQMAWREMKAAGIDPYTDTAEIHFAGTHDAVVYAVLNGKSDVGTVRTDTLERMANEGKIHLDDIKVLPHRGDEYDFSYLHSTRLYPEWPLARLKWTDIDLAELVVRALLDMPADSKAARLSDTMGWTIPLNYHAVHALFQDLQLPPYTPKPVSWRDILSQHWGVVTLLLGGLLITTLLSLGLSRINQMLKRSTVHLQRTRDELEIRVQERTSDLKESEQELETIIDNLPTMVFVKDAEKLQFVRFNKAGERLMGKSREEVIGHSYFDFFPHEMAESFTENDRHVINTGITEDIDQVPIDTPGGKRFLHTRRVCIYGSEGTPKYLLGIANDITEQKEAMEKLDHLATHDPLTGLYNRRVLEERLAEEMERVGRYDDPLSVFMLDIDLFKQVNDHHGHQAGDDVLRGLAQSIEESIRKTDYAARYGGEEFTVVLPVTPLHQAEEMAERLRERIAQMEVPINRDKKLSVTISIGVAAVSDTLDSWEKLLDCADRALYQAKEQGRNQVQVGNCEEA